MPQGETLRPRAAMGLNPASHGTAGNGTGARRPSWEVVEPSAAFPGFGDGEGCKPRLGHSAGFLHASRRLTCRVS
jgi:hypothetical protein